MPAYRNGRHEHGQNFLVDRSIINKIIDLVAATTGPILEIGPGDGALTLPLQQLNRPLTCVEIDESRAARLSRRLDPSTRVITGDFLTYRLPRAPLVVVGNLPFHTTTAMLRKLLHATDWTDAVLLMQWEVARRRAGVGGASMMTAQWWPWFDFTLVCRVPAAAFRPRPTVDGGLLTIKRRVVPLLAPRERSGYQGFVHRVFTGRGRGLPDIIARASCGGSRGAIGRWLGAQRIPAATLPKRLTAEQWAGLYAAIVSHRTVG